MTTNPAVEIDLDKQRAEFEAWAKNNLGHWDARASNGTYYASPMHTAWSVWQGAQLAQARASQAVAAEEQEPVARLDLLIQVDNLCSQIENTLYAFRGDDEAIEQAKGAIAHAKKVSAPYRTYRFAAPVAQQSEAGAPADAQNDYDPQRRDGGDTYAEIQQMLKKVRSAEHGAEYAAAAGALVGYIENRVNKARWVPVEAGADEYEDCPKCKGSRVLGEVRGIRCSNCDGTGSVLVKSEAGVPAHDFPKPPLPNADEHTPQGARLFKVTTLANYGTECFKAGEQAVIAAQKAAFQPVEAGAPTAAAFQPTEQQYLEWCERHDLESHLNRDAFDDAATLYLTASTSGRESAAPLAKQDDWIRVEDRLPDGECLAVYVTESGKQRLIRAKYARQLQIEADGDEDFDTEYNEDDDTFYIKAGWLECIDNWGEYSSCYVVEGVVTHWKPKPALPVYDAAMQKGASNG